MSQITKEGAAALLSDRIDEVLSLVKEELLKAYAKHRGYPSGHYMWAVLAEELEEIWEHVRADTWMTPEARKEAIQLAAMGVRYVLDVAPLRPLCAACDRSDYQEGHADNCPKSRAYGAPETGTTQ